MDNERTITDGSGDVHDAMPVAVRRTLLGLLGVLVVGSVWLIWARGEAILVDLAGLAGKVWCF